MNDLASQIVQCRERAGLSQKELAGLLKTSQQHISRLESPKYQGHSLRMLRRLATVLHVRVKVVFEHEERPTAKAADRRPRKAAKRKLVEEPDSLPVSLL